MLPLAAALLCFFLCFLCRFSCLFLFRGLLCGFLLLRRFLGLPFSGGILCCFLFCRFFLSSGLAAAPSSSGGSCGSGCGRWRSGHYRLAHCWFGQASFFLRLFFLLEIFFERLAVGAAVAEFLFFITSVKCGIVERHCSS